LESIEQELAEHLKFLKGKNKLLEAQRLESRTHYDLEMLKNWVTVTVLRIILGIYQAGLLALGPTV